jgi:predicted phosphodiesterase
MKKILISALFVLSPFILTAQSTESLRITHGPWLQNVTRDGVTVCFTTNLPAVPGILLTRRGTLPDSLVRNSTDGMIDAGGNLHKVRITGLESGKSYSYKVNPVEILKLKPYQVYYGDTITSKEFKFTTQNITKKTTRFLVVNDIHTDGERLARQLKAGQADSCDVVFYNGDMVDFFEDEAQLLTPIIDTSVRYFASSVPFVYIRGNHETRGILSRKLKNYFDYPQGRYYYSFDQGPVHFIILDCGEDKPDDNRYYYGLADYDQYRLTQLEWLKQEVKSEAFRNAAYRIYIVHMPVHPGDGSSHGLLFLSENFGPVIKEAGGDLMIAGHTHRHLWLPEKLSGLGIPILINGNLNRIEAEAGEQCLKIRVLSVTNEVVAVKEVINQR